MTIQTDAVTLKRLATRACLLTLWALNAAVCGSQTLPGERTTQRIPTPFVENGTPVDLEAIIFKPKDAGPGPWPTLVFMHGSTGQGNRPEWFKESFISQGMVNGFVPKGWMVVFPQRRGRGASGGLYDEGFAPDRSAYTCDAAITLKGLERAKEDARVITAWVQKHPQADPQKLLLGGISRGGILSVVHGAEPGVPYRGVLNFVGGWVGDLCTSASLVNTETFAKAGQGKLPTLWLYGQQDPFYSIAHSRANFDAFVAAGGRGIWQTITPVQVPNGHLISARPELWREFVWPFVEQHTPKKP